MSEKKSSKWYTLSKSRNSLTWIALIVINLVAAMGSGIENSWFNTFVFQEVTPDPQATAAMVSFSAVTAALAAIVGGAASDRYRGRWGRRKPFLVVGFLVSGLFCFLFPLGSIIKNVGFAITYVVLTDSLMMIGFGAAYDGVLGGYVTDITNVNNRGRVNTVLLLVSAVGTLLTSVIGGILIDTIGYSGFFMIIAGSLVVNGVLGALLLPDDPMPENEADKQREPFIKEILSNFSLKSIKENKSLFLVLLAIMIWACGSDCTLAYSTTFTLEYLGFTATEVGLISVIPTIIGMLCAIPFGVMSDKWGRKKTSILLVIMMCVGAFLNSTLKPGVSIFTLGIIRVIGMIPMGGWYVNYRAWTRDKFPKERRAQFAGITLLFVVTLPMIIGSQIGSFVVSNFGIPTVVNGNSGFIPTPILYVVSAAISSLSLIPMLLVKEEKKGPDLKETVETQA